MYYISVDKNKRRSKMWRLFYRGRHQSSHFNSQQQSGEAYFPTCPTFPFWKKEKYMSLHAHAYL